MPAGVLEEVVTVNVEAAELLAAGCDRVGGEAPRGSRGQATHRKGHGGTEGIHAGDRGGVGGRIPLRHGLRTGGGRNREVRSGGGGRAVVNEQREVLVRRIVVCRDSVSVDSGGLDSDGVRTRRPGGQKHPLGVVRGVRRNSVVEVDPEKTLPLYVVPLTVTSRSRLLTQAFPLVEPGASVQTSITRKGREELLMVPVNV